MQTNHRNEIAASLAAQQSLGSGYDEALAEGLVERIGEEIDQRIEARVDQRITGEADSPPGSGPHLDCRHARRVQRRATRQAERAERAGRPSVTLALGSLAGAILASLTVLLTSETNVATSNGFTKTGPTGSALFLTALIWIVIGVINVVHARRRL
ncbi:MAG TPA: hypothetical protein VGM53_20030 [Streptosporangiaceae bacterium]|jgi:hypothetical protein